MSRADDLRLMIVQLEDDISCIRMDLDDYYVSLEQLQDELEELEECGK